MANAFYPPLRHGDLIGVFAPSSYVERSDMEAAQATLEDQGYKVYIHPQTFERDHQSAGSLQHKLEALHSLYTDPSIKAIWAAGGGNRALMLLDSIDFDVIGANPKPMIGFSDVTALLNIITAQTGIINIHGPVLKNIKKHKDLKELLAILSGESVSMPIGQAHILRHGRAEGPLFGGNLSLFHYLPQTSLPDFTNGAILFLEDCNEEMSRIDRMFIHLKRLGVLEHINGLILGEFSDLQDSSRPFGFTLEDIVHEHMNGFEGPILINAPFGHGKHLFPLPIGKVVILDSESTTLVF